MILASKWTKFYALTRLTIAFLPGNGGAGGTDGPIEAQKAVNIMNNKNRME